MSKAIMEPLLCLELSLQNIHGEPSHAVNRSVVWLQDMKRHGLVNDTQLEEAHRQSVIQMQHIQDAAARPSVTHPSSAGR